MKKLLTSLILSLFVCSGLNAQMVNEKGEKTYMANVAVVVNENIYNIENGKMVKVRVPGRESLTSALTLYLTNHFAQNGFLIVNSDASINQKINAVIEENKLEEYIDGLAIQAKNVGGTSTELCQVVLPRSAGGQSRASLSWQTQAGFETQSEF